MNKVILAAVLCLPFAAWARSTAGSVDLAYVPSADLKARVAGPDGFTDDGSGYVLKATVPLKRAMVVTGQYDTASYDDSDTEFGTMRLGFGFVTGTGGITAEVVQADLDGEDAEGYGLHLRLQSDPDPGSAQFHADLGYLSVTVDSDARFSGLELSLGGTYWFAGKFGAFAEYRSLDLDHSDLELSFNDYRVGARFRL